MMESKICTKCAEEKPFSDYHKINDKPIGICKICKNTQSKEYRKNNKEYFNEYYKKYNKDNNETLTNYRKEFYQKYNKDGEFHKRRVDALSKNINEIKRKQKIYRENNKEKIKEYQKEYGKTNRIKLNEYKIKYSKSNPHIKAWITVLGNSLKRFGKSKEGHTIDLLGYSALDLKEHIESLFTDGMSWDNHGEWHIDHIKPVSSFDKDTPMNIVNALSNLQPLWATTREINGVIYEGNLNKNKY
jgi:hypothetical protein